MNRFLRICCEASVYAACAAVREPLLRWPAFAFVWLIEAPGYFWGAFHHDRLGDPAFWSFTAETFRAGMGGSLVEMFE